MSIFKDDVRRFVEVTAPNKVNRTARQIALALFRKVIMRTPVGNPSVWKSKRGPKGYVGGRARGNWQCNIGPESTAAATEMRDADGNNTVEKAMDVLSEWQPMGTGQTGMGGAGRETPIWIGNALPYIQRLEYDHWSQQARNGMVRISLSEIRVGGVALGEAPTL